ncbi:MAG: transporter substrate-binding domain-containing protein [Oleispira sp.]
MILLIVLCTISSASFAKNCDTLSVNGADGWYPYFSRQNPEHLGIMGDVVSKAAHRAGLNLELRPSIPWKRILLNLRNGDLDVIAGALKTQQRAKQFDFSTAVHFAELRVFVRNDRAFQFKQLSDLIGKIGGKVRGMSLGQEADNYSFNNLVLDDVPSPKSLFKMVASKRLEYGIFYGSTGRQELERDNLSAILDILPVAVATEDLFMAYSKRSQCQRQITLLNNEIQKMKDDGSIDLIIQYYQAAIASQDTEGKK